MEDVEVKERLKQSLVKKENLHRAHDQARAQTNALMVFSLQWKDLELHFDGIARELSERLNKVEAAEERIRAAERKVTVRQRIEESELEIGSKEEKLGFLKQRLDFCEREVGSKEEKLGFVERRLERCEIECREKEGKLISLCLEIEEKEKELSSLKKSISEKLGVLEKCSHVFDREIFDRKDKVGSLLEMLEKCDFDCRKKTIELISLQHASNECDMKIKEKEKELGSLKKSISECHETFSSTKGELDQQSKELELQEERMNEVKRLISESSAFHMGNITAKRKEFDSLQLKLEERSRELSSMENSIEECSKRLDSKRDELESISKTAAQISAFLDDRVRDLDMRERGIVEKERKFQQRQLEELRRHQQNLHVTTACPVGFPVPWTDLNPTSSGNSSNGCQIMTEPPSGFPSHNEDNSAPSVPQYAGILPLPTDTAKLTLDEIYESYGLQPVRGEVSFEPVALRKHIVLLEQLRISSPPITPQVAGEAMRLAANWVFQLRAKDADPLEVLVFLHLLAAFKLASFFSRDEVLELIERHSLRDKAPHLCQNLVDATLVPPNPADFFPQQGSWQTLSHALKAKASVISTDSGKCTMTVI